ncbi:unnamed protein product [Arabis nemorensis]|uniref:CCHC-type domain-containing protein n=1 Tax=Arabis nemorensis TaxID=586526 RepID=A0A565BDY4_9BRAS|nr:unnamed protein product [Arabis nemorensis]
MRGGEPKAKSKSTDESLEYWYMSIIVLMTGYTKDVNIAIAAFSICQCIFTWVMNVSVGLMGAACVRVANELGKGDADAVKFSIKVVLVVSAVIGVTWSGVWRIIVMLIVHVLKKNASKNIELEDDDTRVITGDQLIKTSIKGITANPKEASREETNPKLMQRVKIQQVEDQDKSSRSKTTQELTCYRCKKQGDVAKVCPTRKTTTKTEPIQQILGCDPQVNVKP